MKKNILLLTFIMAAVLSGCTQMIELTSEEEDLVAEYAAGRMINYYRQCIGEIPRSSSSTTTTSSASAKTVSSQSVGDASVSTSSDNLTSGDLTADDKEASKTLAAGQTTDLLENLLGLSDVEITQLGYSVNDKYPTDAYSFSVNAPTGYKLLVVEYQIKNTAGVDNVIGVDSSHAGVTALVNGSETVSLYRTMLKNDIANMDGTTIKAGESTTGVFVFRIKDELADDVTSVNVSITAK